MTSQLPPTKGLNRVKGNKYVSTYENKSISKSRLGRIYVALLSPNQYQGDFETSAKRFELNLNLTIGDFNFKLNL